MSVPAYDLDRLLPHTGAMRLLHRVTHVDLAQAVAEVDIDADATFASADGVPAWVGLEYMAQAMAVWMGARAAASGQEPQRGLVLGTRRYTAHVPSFPVGATVRVVAIPESVGPAGVATFRCTLHDATAPTDATPWCESVLTAMIGPLGDEPRGGAA